MTFVLKLKVENEALKQVRSLGNDEFSIEQ